MISELARSKVNEMILEEKAKAASRFSIHREMDLQQGTSLMIPLAESEEAAIREYARLCGESTADLVRKVVIRDATLADGFGSDDPFYDYEVMLPDQLSPNARRKLLEEGYTKIRAAAWGGQSDCD